MHFQSAGQYRVSFDFAVFARFTIFLPNSKRSTRLLEQLVIFITFLPPAIYHNGLKVSKLSFEGNATNRIVVDMYTVNIDKCVIETFYLLSKK